jgi:signal transduction histidine kinase/CheY-like chemotaxis protein
MWRVIEWLARVPIADPVDRRNAPVMQLLMMFIGCVVPLNSAYYVFLVGLRHRPGWVVDLGTDLLITLMAWVALVMIRHGRFRLAIVLFLATVLASASAAYASAGFQVSLTDKIPMLMLALGGLVLGRRALWAIFGLLMAIFGLGMFTDVMRSLHAGLPADHGLSSAPPVVLGYLIIAIVLDRTIAALRESLAESTERGIRLQHEIIEREHAQEQLVHAQKMEAIGRLAGGVAHDFNNILGVILGFASERDRSDEIDTDPAQDAAAMSEALEGVEMAARRGAAISNKLLSFSRNDVTRPECFDTGKALRELAPMLRQLFGSAIAMSVTIDPQSPLPIRFDRSQFELMMLNLAANARDAMPDGGRFALTAERSSPPNAPQVLITLTDTGKGMSEDVQKRIFEPFYTTKPSGSGTGLGLAVTYSLIAGAGGEISVASIPDKGSSFRIALPLVEFATQPDMNLAPATAIHVLLVEDDHDLRQQLASALIADGCAVDEAADGAHALQIIEATPMHDVLICDHHMPGTHGDELYRALRLRMPEVPMILISSTQGGSSDDFRVTRLPKPFPPASLLQLVRRVTAGRNEGEGFQPPIT